MLKKMDFLNFITFCLLINSLIETSQGSKAIEEICRAQKNCSQCIQAVDQVSKRGLGCKWCADIEKLTPPFPSFWLDRCFYNDKEKEKRCTEVEYAETKVTTEETGSHSSMVRPHHVHAKLRPREPVRISVSYKDPGNRPLDLYVLMDLSCTMSPHRERVGRMTTNLARSLGNITTKLKLGFGSFVDKPLQPFSRERWEETNTCNGKNITTVKPHVFRNELSLTHNVTQFIRTVEGAKTLTNQDEPEAGLEALMQVLACKDEIGWTYQEEQAMRLIVLATDGSFHIAGDGKLAGILKANDEKCHLKENTTYTHDAIHDYPSIAQIRKAIQTSNIYVIFAVTANQATLYTKLSRTIGSGITSVRTIGTNDASSITAVVEDEYRKIAKRIDFQVKPGVNQFVDVGFHVDCDGTGNFQPRAGCDNVTEKKEVKYQVELTLRECPSNQNRQLWKNSIAVGPSTSSLSEGSGTFLNITFDMLCGCDCEGPNVTGVNDTQKCGAKSDVQQCGMCTCLPGFHGPLCSCSTGLRAEACLDSRGLECGGRGTCICGECKSCATGYFGKLCECSKMNCPQPLGDEGVCNSRGNCTCNGQCICEVGFTGERCQCDRQKCMYNGEVCGGRGRCDCDKCVCNDQFQGQKCEINAPSSDKCEATTSKRAGPCLQCFAEDQAGTGTENCKARCKREKVMVTLYTSADQGNNTGTLRECYGEHVSEDSNGRICTWSYFSRGLDEGGGGDTGFLHLVLRGVLKPDCRDAPSYFVPIVSSIGVILLIGLLTLLGWKLITHFHDKQEWERFEKERVQSDWAKNDNPLYKGTVSEFQNPVYSIEDD